MAGIKDTRSASGGRAAEAEWRATLRDEQALIARKKQVEEALLGKYLKELQRVYGVQKPTDLKKADLQKHGERLFTLFSQIRARITTVIKGEMRRGRRITADALPRLSHLFAQKTLSVEARKAKQRWHRIQRDQDEIIKELDEVVSYWEGISKRGTLPSAVRFWEGGKTKFNHKMIVRHIQQLQEAELEFLTKIDREFQKEAR